MLNTFLSFFKSSESYSFPNRVLTSSSLKSSISSCNHLAPLSLSFSLSLSLSSFDHPYVQHPAHGKRHGNILWSFGEFLFSINKQGNPVVYTPSRGSFFGRRQRERGRNRVAAEQRGGALIRTDKFRAWPGIHTRTGELRFAERNCRNRNRWIFQRILCSVLAPPRLMAFAHTCRVLSSPLSPFSHPL